MVGMPASPVTVLASSAGIDSSTTAKAPASSQRFGVGDQPPGFRFRAGLRPEPAQLVYRLRRQAQVSHHRNAGVHDAAHGLAHRPAALHLHRVRSAFLDQPAGVAQRFRRG